MLRMILLAGVVALVGCQTNKPGARVDPALSTLVPADTTLLVGIRAEEMMKLPLYQRYLADRPIGPLDEFAKRTGLNVRTDVWEVLLISNGKETVVLGRGKFANEAEPRLKVEGTAKRFGYKTYTFIGDEETAVLFLGPTVAGFGSTAALRRVVDTRDQTNGPPAVLAKRMAEIPREAVIWSAYAGGFEPPKGIPPNFANLVKVLNSIESGSFYLDLRLGLKGKATGSAPTDPAAKELHDALRGLLGFARLGITKGRADMQHLLDGVRVTQDGRNVNVYVDAPEEALEQLADAWFGLGQNPKQLKVPPRK